MGTHLKPIPLSQGMVAWVSDEDFEKASAYKWHASAQGRQGDRYYACRHFQKNGKRTKVWLHRFVMDLPHSLEGCDPLVVDHIDGDGLNCTRENLQVCLWSENLEWVNNRLRRKKDQCEPSL